MFCSNCGSRLVEGAKFCSECGTKVEVTKVRDLGALNVEEPERVNDTIAGEPMGAEEAFQSKVSFDWSNVIDEPQKKEIPQGIKSPWSATTDGIDERDIYSEMNKSDDRKRTMSFIDVLKADKEERERAALDKSIEYTEVLEYDPEAVGGTKPPKLRMAPLYEDVDEPVKTPFDDLDDTDDAAETDIPEANEGIEEAAPAHTAEAAEGIKEEAFADSSKFELPDFLKKAVGFGTGRDEVVEVEREPLAETAEEPVPLEPVAEEATEAVETVEVAEEAVITDTAVDTEAAEEAVSLEPVAEEATETVETVEVAEEAVITDTAVDIEATEEPAPIEEVTEPVAESFVEEEIAAEEPVIVDEPAVAAYEEMESVQDSIQIDEFASAEPESEETDESVDVAAVAEGIEPAESFVEEEPVAVEEAAPIEHVAEEPVVVDEPAAEAADETESMEDAYLDEDLYLELTEAPRSNRISRIVAHADEYEADDDEEGNDGDDIDGEAFEEELFSEMSQPEPKKTGMTIAAPADEEAEIEALKRRLAELTGTVEIDPSLLEETDSEPKEEPAGAAPAAEAPIIETPVEETAPMQADVIAPMPAEEIAPTVVDEYIEEAEVQPEVPAVEPMEEPAAPADEPAAAPAEGSFEALGADFAFEPEVTTADHELFAGLTAASEVAAKHAAAEEVMAKHAAPEEAAEPAEPAETAESEKPAESATSFGLSFEDELIANKPFTEEPAEAVLIEEAPATEAPVEETAPMPAEEIVPTALEEYIEEAKEPGYEPAAVTEEPVAEPADVQAAETEPLAEASVEDLFAQYLPQYFNESSVDEVAAEPVESALFEAFPTESTTESAGEDSPIVGFAPAVTEPQETVLPETSPAAEPAVISLDDFITDAPEPVAPAEPEIPEAPAVPAAEEPKATDAVSLEELERDLFGAAAPEEVEAETTKKIDKFYTLYRKNEEFQRLLDEEYSKLKGEHIEVPEDDALTADPVADVAASLEAAAANAGGAAPVASEPKSAAFSADSVLEDLAGDARPVEDATIYRVDMPEDPAAIAATADQGNGFSVGGEEAKSFGLGAAGETAAAAGAVAATTAAVAAGAETLTKAEKKAARNAEKQRKKEEAAAAQVEYEDVDSGSTVLTILAVIVAILLVILLAVILILHVAPDSGIAMTIDEFIENITSRFSAVDVFGGQRLL